MTPKQNDPNSDNGDTTDFWTGTRAHNGGRRVTEGSRWGSTTDGGQHAETTDFGTGTKARNRGQRVTGANTGGQRLMGAHMLKLRISGQVEGPTTGANE